MASETSSPLGSPASYRMEDSSEVQMDGYLRKRTSKKSGILHVRSWKKRWFFLAGGMLMYAPGPHHASRRIREAFHVADIRDVHLSTGMLEFEVEMRSRTLELRAKSSNEMKRWMSAIRAAREAAIVARMKLVESQTRTLGVRSPVSNPSQEANPFEGKSLRCPSSDLSHLAAVDWEDKCQVSASATSEMELRGGSLSWGKERSLEDDMAALGGLGQKSTAGKRRASVPWQVREKECAEVAEGEGQRRGTQTTQEREIVEQGSKDVKDTDTSTKPAEKEIEKDVSPTGAEQILPPKPRAWSSLTGGKYVPRISCPDMPSGSSTNPLHESATSTESTPRRYPQEPRSGQRDRRSTLRWQSFTDKFAASLEDFTDFGRKEDVESSLYKISLGRRNVGGCHTSTFRISDPALSQTRSSEGVGRFRVGGWASADNTLGGAGSPLGLGSGLRTNPWRVSQLGKETGSIIKEEESWKVEDMENLDSSSDKGTPRSVEKRLPLYASQKFNVGRVSSPKGLRARSWGGGEFGENKASTGVWTGAENVDEETSGFGGSGQRSKLGHVKNFSLAGLGLGEKGRVLLENKGSMGVQALLSRS